ncbi:MAG: hypothetical protein R3E12_02935 [Candidatus Eisenbacteria bacterium]|uniref:Cytochrome c domain-containing protein n=1 Tax=Eiseniibacteriota bacterium TaxID=2212470 RepID=A0A956M094_UNCEI|nr:hypothetical protein [Candidatus Eisenbacteria bacterium]
MRTHRPARGRNVLAAVGLLLASVGCASLESLAPPVDALALGMVPDVDPVVAGQGREVYLSRACVGCHTPHAVDSLRKRDWRPVLQDMSDRASLNATDRQAVEVYVLAVLTAPRVDPDSVQTSPSHP